MLRISTGLLVSHTCQKLRLKSSPPDFLNKEGLTVATWAICASTNARFPSNENLRHKACTSAIKASCFPAKFESEIRSEHQQYTWIHVTSGRLWHASVTCVGTDIARLKDCGMCVCDMCRKWHCYVYVLPYVAKVLICLHNVTLERLQHACLKWQHTPCNNRIPGFIMSHKADNDLCL